MVIPLFLAIAVIPFALAMSPIAATNNAGSPSSSTAVK